jgi:hypothetical protein
MFAADSGKALLAAQEETAEATDDADAASQNAAVNSDVFDSMDSDGDGVISESEFTAALQSKVDGETLSEDETSEAAASTESAASSASESYDPLDTNEDGVVSAAERAAGEMDSFGLLNGTTLGALMQFNEVSQAA